ncbi:hypothetical protein GCM10023116_05070 [Kistimonas scapharcae]|uniref:N-acetyltransferase domain-containing protein n=1 Tax=Kistimonas scapharcae TaxID=1036133 RepID=A0ABP8UWN0_9GAMM
MSEPVIVRNTETSVTGISKVQAPSVVYEKRLGDDDIHRIFTQQKPLRLRHIESQALLELTVKIISDSNRVKLKIIQTLVDNEKSFATLSEEKEDNVLQLQDIQTHPVKCGLGTLLVHVASYYAVHIEQYPTFEVKKAAGRAFGFYQKLGFDFDDSSSPTYLQITSKTLLENTRHICQKFHAITNEYPLCPQATMTSWKSLPVLP